MERDRSILPGFWRVFAAVWMLVTGGVCAPAVGQVSPFEDVEWGDAGLVRVMVGGEWWEPVSIAGVSVEGVYRVALARYGSAEKAQKRMDEDLLEVLAEAGVERAEKTVGLVLRPVGGGEVVTLPAVEMTRANRQRLWAKRKEAEESDAGDVRAGVDPFVEVMRHGLDAVRLDAMFDEFAEVLETRHSYSAARGVDVRAAVQEERARIGAPASMAEVGRGLQRVLALTGDGHARVGGRLGMVQAIEETGRNALPVALMPLDLHEGGRVVAVKEDGSALLSASHPFVESIDGVEIERWLAVAEEVAPGGTAASRRYGACRAARGVVWIRGELGIENGQDGGGDVELVLRSAGGERETVRLALAQERVRRGYRHEAGEFAAARARELAAEAGLNLVYVPIDLMRSRETWAEEGVAAPWELLNTAGDVDGVIIDIRGNTGGARDVLHEIAACIRPADALPMVYSAARALMWPGRDAERVEHGLAGRYLRSADDPTLHDVERAAIARFAAAFVPEVELDDARFGPVHYAVLRREDARYGRPGVLAGTPVVVLMDERCISASDVFLAALKGLPGVTLVGRPSRGASGMSEVSTIGGGLGELKVSTMVSFMPDGRVFDWHGVEPDVAVELTPGDFTQHGPDTALAEAVRVLRAQVRARE